MEKITEPDNLRLAWLKAIKGKRCKSVVLNYRKSLDENLRELGDSLFSGARRWGPYYTFTIFDPKEREIKVAPLEDRIAYHAIMNYCEPIFDSYQIFNSYACRQGKGQWAALECARVFSRQNVWYLKCDIRKYFDSISHVILRGMLEKRFKDSLLLDTFNNLIESYNSEPGKGIPIGSLTSQFFANHYLGSLDHYIKRDLHCGAYLRYMDDFVLWGSKEELLKYRDSIDLFCADNLGLTLKQSEINQVQRGLPFLGLRVYPNSIRLSHRARYRYRSKIIATLIEWNQGALTEEEFCNKINSLNAFMRMADSLAFRQRVWRETGIGS